MKSNPFQMHRWSHNRHQFVWQHPPLTHPHKLFFFNPLCSKQTPDTSTYQKRTTSKRIHHSHNTPQKFLQNDMQQLTSCICDIFSSRWDCWRLLSREDSWDCAKKYRENQVNPFLYHWNSRWKYNLSSQTWTAASCSLNVSLECVCWAKNSSFSLSPHPPTSISQEHTPPSPNTHECSKNNRWGEIKSTHTHRIFFCREFSFCS